MLWQTLSKLVPGRRPAQKATELLRCYEAVFKSAEGQVVLADLATFSDFYFANGEDLPSDRRAYRDGKRAVIARALGMLRMSEAEREALETAFREEILDQ